MPLQYTDRFETVRGLEARAERLSVLEASKLIRFELNGLGAEKLLGALRKISFVRTGAGEASAEHGKESLGRSVERSVQQTDQIPETFTVKVPVFANQGMRDITVCVTCGIYLDTENECVQIRPLADEIASAMNAAQNSLHDLLVTALGTRVFRGSA
jgi:hypothetical protein